MAYHIISSFQNRILPWDASLLVSEKSAFIYSTWEVKCSTTINRTLPGRNNFRNNDNKHNMVLIALPPLLPPPHPPVGSRTPEAAIAHRCVSRARGWAESYCACATCGQESVLPAPWVRRCHLAQKTPVDGVFRGDSGHHVIGQGHCDSPRPPSGPPHGHQLGILPPAGATISSQEPQRVVPGTPKACSGWRRELWVLLP